MTTAEYWYSNLSREAKSVSISCRSQYCLIESPEDSLDIRGSQSLLEQKSKMMESVGQQRKTQILLVELDEDDELAHNSVKHGNVFSFAEFKSLFGLLTHYRP